MAKKTPGKKAASKKKATTKTPATKRKATKKTAAKRIGAKRTVSKRPGAKKKTAARKRVVKAVRRAREVALVGRAAGFDTGSYPGDAAITAWAAQSPYAFVGFYFDAPCHTTNTFKTWHGTSAFIRGTGLGLVVIYVGFQQDGCGKSKLSRDKGVEHGLDTIAKFKAEGFRPGTIVFLDVEHFDGALSTKMEDYIRGWIGAVLDDGTVGPGIYCPASKAIGVRLAAQKEYAAHGRPGGSPVFWIVKVGDPQFDIATSNPEDCGVPFASVWQGVIDTSEKHGAVTIHIDRNVASSANPSGA